MAGQGTGDVGDRRLAEALLALTRELLERSVAPDTYDSILAHALRLVPGAQAGSLVVRDDDGVYRYKAARGFDLAALAEVAFTEAQIVAALSDGAAPSVVRNLDRLNAGQLEPAAYERLQEVGATGAIVATLCVPIVLDGIVAASFNLDSFDDPEAFDDESVRLASALGQHIGAVIRRLWLQERAEEGARIQALRADLERMLVVNDDVRDLFPALAVRLARDLPVDGLVLVQLRPTQQVVAYDRSGARDEPLEEVLERAGALRIVEELVRGGARGRPMWRSLPDAGADPRLWQVADRVGAAEIAVVRRDDEAWGAVAFYSGRPSAFRTQDRVLLETLVEGIELELQHELKRERLHTQVEQLSRLVRTADAIAPAERLEDVAAPVLDVVLDVAAADTAALLVLRDGVLEVAGARRRDGRAPIPTGTRVPRGAAHAWRVLERDRPLVASGEAAAGDAALLEALHIEAADALAGVPVRGRDGRHAGVLMCARCLPGRPFDPQVLGFLEAVAQAVGSALVRLELLDESRAQARDLRVLYQAAQRQAEELAVLEEVRSAVAHELELDEVIRKAVEGTARLIGQPMVSLYLVDGDELVLWHGVGHAHLPARISWHRGVMGRVARSGVAEFVQDVTSDPDFVSAGEHVEREVAVPLTAEGRVLGVLNAESSEDHLDELDFRLLVAIAEQVSIAVQRARLHDEVRDSERRFRLLAEHMRDMVCLHDPGGAFTYVSPSSRALLGYDADELVGRSPLDLVVEEDRADVATALRDLAASGVPGEPLAYRVRHRDGASMWLETIAQSVLGPDGAVVGMVTSSRDATLRKTFEARLVQGALFDELTGLPNRTLLTDRLQLALERHRRAPERHPFALLFVDVDRFKVVNDSLGHSVGDHLLRGIGARLQETVRKVDTVARLGGDEFCILLDDLASAGDAERAAQRVHEALRAPFDLDGRTLYVTASIGIANASGGYESPEEVLRDADLAMYGAKGDGRARHAVFDVGMHARALSRLELETDLRRAIQHGGLDVAYQPIVALSTGRLVGVEALVRWHHPTRGAVPPAEFIPLAEETGLVASIDRFVMREACRQVADWRRLGASELEVSVNVSPRHFSLGDLTETVEDALLASGLPPEALKLEITETALMTSAQVAADVLQRLRERGTLVQIDDFGTGYSSLGLLKRLPIDSLKIDRTFIAGLAEGESEGGIVTAIVELARNLGIEVVAEGIETHEQLAYLRSIGCAHGQGYLFSAPLAAVAFEAAGWMAAAAA